MAKKKNEIKVTATAVEVEKKKETAKKLPVATIVLGVILLVVIGTIIAITSGKLFQKGDDGKMANEKVDVKLGKSASTSEVAQLFAQKKALNCKVTDKTKGTSYQIMANDGFTKIKMISEAEAGTEYMLFIDGELYIWTNYNDIAIKMKAATDTAQLVTDLEKQITPEESIEQKTEKGEPMMMTECDSTEGMDFTPPTDITFKDLGSVEATEVEEKEAVTE